MAKPRCKTRLALLCMSRLDVCNIFLLFFITTPSKTPTKLEEDLSRCPKSGKALFCTMFVFLSMQNLHLIQAAKMPKIGAVFLPPLRSYLQECGYQCPTSTLANIQLRCDYLFHSLIDFKAIVFKNLRIGRTLTQYHQVPTSTAVY